MIIVTRIDHPIDKLLVAHQEATKVNDKVKVAGLEKKIADSIQKDTNRRLGDQFHVRIVLYPGPKP